VITHLQLPNKNKISSADAYNAYREFFCINILFALEAFNCIKRGLIYSL